MKRAKLTEAVGCEGVKEMEGGTVVWEYSWKANLAWSRHIKGWCVQGIQSLCKLPHQPSRSIKRPNAPRGARMANMLFIMVRHFCFEELLQVQTACMTVQLLLLLWHRFHATQTSGSMANPVRPWFWNLSHRGPGKSRIPASLSLKYMISSKHPFQKMNN